MSTQISYPCPECHMGALRPSQALFFSGRLGQPLCIPGFPAWTCDICGHTEYDPKAIAELQVMLYGETSRSKRRAHRKGVDGKPPGLHADPPRRSS